MAEETLEPTAPFVEETTATPAVEETTESFGDAFAEFERTNQRKADDGSKQIDATVVTLDADSVFLDIGFKTEGVLPRAALPNNADEVNPGDRMLVSVRGRNAEGYYELSRVRVVQPTDWSTLVKAFEEKTPITGTVTAVVKGGVSVDVGVRAFMPASRTGTRDAAELEKLVGQTIACNIIKLDTEAQDVVVDRRAILEAEQKELAQAKFATMSEGEIVTGTVRSLASYGAFVDIGGMDGLLHVSDISWTRIAKPEDAVEVGQELTLKVLKIDAENNRISLGLKQLQAEPWDAVPGKYTVGERVTGTVTRLADFGAFVELEPGIEGLIHVSEMSWVKKVKKPSDLLTVGETVEAAILKIDTAERRISLGLKQALGDPWSEVPLKFPVGAEVEGPVTRLATFGAFVELAEGVEGLVHISEIVADKRLAHPQDAVRVGEVVKAVVLAIDPEKRQIKLSIKQLQPTGLTEYLEERQVGDTVSGRVVSVSGENAVVELGEGIRAIASLKTQAAPAAAAPTGGVLDLSALGSMLKDRWKTGGPVAGSASSAVEAGQIRSFKITKLDVAAKSIELQLA
ncbi:MAG: 30S ribosomal protein S1 [Acidobacteriaceae bacterium]|nr:30S ribosomal protein S1 [Acidobacteriaceae bacterium]